MHLTGYKIVSDWFGLNFFPKLTSGDYKNQELEDKKNNDKKNIKYSGLFWIRINRKNLLMSFDSNHLQMNPTYYA